METQYPVDLDAIASPALLFRESAIEKNLDLMVQLAGRPDRLRPHVKTHKCPVIITRHLDRGITKFKCATIAEAEMTARNGASSVLLAKQPVGPDVERLISLSRAHPNTEWIAIVDALEPFAALSQALEKSGDSLGVMIDVNCGMNRTGIQPGPELESLYQATSTASNVKLRGLHVYDGHIHQSDLEERKQACHDALAPVYESCKRLVEAGFERPQIVAGGSPTFSLHAQDSRVTECSPGTTVLWDFGYQDDYPDLPFEPAAFVMGRVISRLSEDRVCLDLGHKAISADKPQPRLRFRELPDAVFETHSEEHLVVQSPNCRKLKIGTRLLGIPQHICPTVSLYDYASIINDEDQVIARWSIEARSRRLSV